MLKIKFTDFWADFNYTNNYFLDQLRRKFECEISDTPEILFYSFAGDENRKYMNCIRFFFTGENIRPDFSTTDYAISYDFINSSRHYRWPLYNLYGLDMPPVINKNRSKFCCMVVSNDQCTYRNLFFEELNKIKKVDSGGRYKNNIGGPIVDKLDFLKQYKFCLAFENSSYPGYVTEKLLEAKKSGCIPIYWGNPLIGKDFNEDAFINVHLYKNWNDLFQYLLLIDSDKNLFDTIQNNSLIIHNTYTNRNDFCNWIVQHLFIPTDRKKIINRKFRPKVDFFWIRVFLQYSWKDILHRKIGIKRAIKILRYKA